MNVQSPYTAQPGQKEVTVTLSGTDSKGSSVSLGKKVFKVKKAPKPNLLWNGVPGGSKAPKSGGGSLSCIYGPEVPFLPTKGKFRVVSYYITFPGSKTPLEGTGSAISAAHMAIIKGAPGGVSIEAVVTGSYNGPVQAIYK
jgi:hypothetical protein